MSYNCFSSPLKKKPKIILFVSSICFAYTCWFTKDDDVGIVYQDKDTEAAVLVNHDAEDDALILVLNLESFFKPFPVVFVCLLLLLLMLLLLP